LLTQSDIAVLQEFWRPVSMVYNESFAESYNLMHQAAQFLAIAGKSVFPPHFDDSHTAFSWDYVNDCFAGAWMHFNRSLRLELHPAELKLCIVCYGRQQLTDLTLDKKTKKDIYSHLRQMLSEAGVTINHFITDMHYDIPRHDVCGGAKYRVIDPGHNREICNYYSNGYLLLNLIKGKNPFASPILCWPHHFDLSLDFPLNGPPSGQNAVISIGYAPADTQVNEPHYYIQPSNSGDLKLIKLPKLKYGKWFNNGETGCYLAMSDIQEKKDVSGQVKGIINFFNEGYNCIISMFE
jgi:hypothetical protein